MKHLTLCPTKLWLKTASHWLGCLPFAKNYWLLHKMYMQYIVVNGVSSKPLSACHFQCAPGFCPARPSFSHWNCWATIITWEQTGYVCWWYSVAQTYNRQASDYQHLQQDVEALGKWANNNHLSFNPSKLKAMVFSKKRHPVSAASYFSLNQSRLENVNWQFCVPGHHYLIKLISFRTNPDRRTTFWKKKR